MIVILNKDVKGAGKAGDVVRVNDGYARNFLLPRGYAREATSGNIRNLEKQKALTEQRKAEEKAAARKLAEDLQGKKVVIVSRGGEGGKLFGSITSKDIAEAAEKQLDIKLDKKKIQLEGPIKSMGRFDVEIKLYQEITGKITVEVTDQNGENNGREDPTPRH